MTTTTNFMFLDSLYVGSKAQGVPQIDLIVIHVPIVVPFRYDCSIFQDPGGGWWGSYMLLTGGHQSFELRVYIGRRR